MKGIEYNGLILQVKYIEMTIFVSFLALLVVVTFLDSSVLPEISSDHDLCNLNHQRQLMLVQTPDTHGLKFSIKF